MAQMPVMHRRFFMLHRCSLQGCNQQAQYESHDRKGFYLCGHHMGLIAMGSRTAQDEAEKRNPPAFDVGELEE